MRHAFTSSPLSKTWYTVSIVILTLAAIFIVFEKIYFQMVKGIGGF